MISFIEQPCCLCGASDWRLLYAGFTAGDRHIDSVRCKQCGLVSLRPIVCTDPAEFYDDKYFRDLPTEADANLPCLAPTGIVDNYARYAALLERHRRPGRLLDVGCGEGWLLRAARDRGWDVLGLDVSPAACQHVRRTYAIDVLCGTVSDLADRSEQFDAVTMRHVLEHTVDPMATVSGIRRLLRPGGILFLDVPNASGLASGVKRLARRATGKGEFGNLAPFVHNYDFSPATLRQLLVRAGYDIAELRAVHRGHPTHNPLGNGFGIRHALLKTVGLAERILRRGSLLVCCARKRSTEGSAACMSA